MSYEDAPVVERAMLRQLAGIALSLTKQRSFACKATLFRLQSIDLQVLSHCFVTYKALLLRQQSIALYPCKA
jgi:hypothetical protein